MADTRKRRLSLPKAIGAILLGAALGTVAGRLGGPAPGHPLAQERADAHCAASMAILQGMAAERGDAPAPRPDRQDAYPECI